MLRTAVIGDEISQDLSEVIALALKYQFHGVEIRSVWGKQPLELDRADCLRIVAELENAGLSIPAFASPAFKVDLPTSVQRKEAARSVLESSIERAEWLRTPKLRIFSFLRQGDPNPIAAAQAMNETLKFIEGCPVQLIVETGTRTNTPNALTMLKLMSEIGSNNLGVLWDPGNGIFSGLDVAPYPDSYLLLCRHIRHVHVKDPIGNDSYARLGRGDLPWQKILNKLSADGYEGFVSLETHWRPGRTLTVSERDNPSGYGFSAGGYEASEICMRILLGMLSKIP